MEVVTKYIMTTDPEMEKLENEWKEAKKFLIRGMITQEALDFLEEMAFKDFGMMKKGAIGMELTRLILIAKEHITD